MWLNTLEELREIYQDSLFLNWQLIGDISWTSGVCNHNGMVFKFLLVTHYQRNIFAGNTLLMLCRMACPTWSYLFLTNRFKKNVLWKARIWCFHLREKLGFQFFSPWLNIFFKNFLKIQIFLGNKKIKKYLFGTEVPMQI